MAIDNQRENEINLFLRHLANSSRTKTLNAETIYFELVFYNIPTDKRFDLSNYFDYWQQIFANDSQTSVFVDSNWNFFCQFVSSSTKYNKPSNDPVKIYLALKPEFLALGVNQIFKFLADNNIKHRSKIGRFIRTDNIVIRVYDLNEAKKLINYINCNEYLVKGHSDISPLCFKNGIVGLAIDNYHSYNMIVCNLITKYLEYKKQLRELDTVNCHDLCDFVRRYDLRQAFYNQRENFIRSDADIPFIEEIKNLFIKSLSSSNVEDFYQHYYTVFRNKHLKNIQHSANNSHLVNNSVDTNNMFKDLVSVMQGTATKYNDSHVYNALLTYLLNGNPTGFTRIDAYGNTCRSLINKYDYRLVCEEILKRSLGLDELSNENREDLNNNMVIRRLADYFYRNCYQEMSLKK